MRVTQCLFNSRTALYRVFVSPFEKVEALTRRSSILSMSNNFRVPPPFMASTPDLSRYASLVARHKKRGNSQQNNTKKSGPPADGDIRDRMIMVVGDDNKLTGPFQTRKVLASLDLAEESLRKVSPANRGAGDDQPQYAVCKIINRREEDARVKALEKAAKENARKASRMKELELNWAIAPHDMGHKLKQFKTFLEKGYKVEVLLAKKKGSRGATRDEADALIQSVRDVLQEVPGAKEWKAEDGVPLKVMKLYFSPPGRASKKGADADEVDEADEADASEDVSESAPERK
ncbi:Translation initiation factor IF-3 [Colletotrichum sidae]|uniref:Translation initiation factor IF-3 n=3 Tax=Colletotrichum orbiculare species complex TaxID=2707354 RepID=N4VJZ4_COLOR|nr:Translation initiation factor IF-3 [Colletotrichum orbiculare MAFF 240422]TDZ59836.1 Translation initiation factor IF-3 [Colletotrichum trifolii]TEA22235.1 Translation initiation factor IF-3 [Colletotrichum sidae]